MNIAKLSLELDASGSKRAFRVLPAGKFRAIDGRPHNGYWTMTEQVGRAIIARLAARASDIVIDYEHALLKSTANATQAIDVVAAGWYKTMEWRQDGLYVVDARWTDKALAQIDSKQYRYISPMFNFDEANNVSDLINFSLVAYPGIDGLTDLAALRGELHNPQDPERAKIMWMLGLGPCPSGMRNAVALAATTAHVSDEISSQVFRAFGLSSPNSQGQTAALSGCSSSSPGGIESQVFKAFGLESPAMKSSITSLAATTAQASQDVSSEVFRAFGLSAPISQVQTASLNGGASSSPNGIESQVFKAFGLEPPAASYSMATLAAHASTSARRKAEVDKIYRAFGLEPPR